MSGVGVLNGGVQPGDTVAIVGAGPIGLATIMTAKLFTPGRIIAIDIADARLEKALEFGADVTINNATEDPIARVMELTQGLGVDVATRVHRGGSGDDLAPRGLGLQPLRDVHRVADHRVLQPAAAADRAGHDDAGVQADADVEPLDLRDPPPLGVQLALTRLHVERTRHRTARVIVHRDRRAEQCGGSPGLAR